MQIRILKLKIENFKGIKSFVADLGGGNAIIRAENGVGKTTIYDAFLWLLFDKDSTGRKNFGLRPLDSYNQPLKGLVLAVEAVIGIDGAIHTFRKEHHEKVVRDQLRGYETQCWIDEVPKKVGEFSEYIAELVPEDTFKLLTDLSHFNEKFHWSQRREILLDITGDVGTPKGFGALLGRLNGRSIAEYKQVLSGEKKRYEQERDEINPRIDEIQRGLNEYAGGDAVDEKALTEKREQIKAIIKGLDSKRQSLSEQEQARQKKIEHLNKLKEQKMYREAELASDNSAVQALLDKKAEIEKSIAEKKRAIADAENALTLKNSQIARKKIEIEAREVNLDVFRAELQKITDTPTSDICYACSQKLPANKIAENQKVKDEKKAQLTKDGNVIFREVESLKKELAALEQEIPDLVKSVDVAVKKSIEAQKNRDKEIASIDQQIKLKPKPLPEKDQQWQQICAEIEQVEKQIGEPVSEQLRAIDSQRTAKTDELASINNTLAQSDRIVKDTARIKELDQREKELAQAIADVEGQLNEIQQYEYAESKLTESAVNDRFKYVRFKLFNQLLNGGLEPCCDTLFDGKPWPDMSNGERIFSGIDIINTLSQYYKLSVVLFIDQAESFTLPCEATSQTIKLFAEKNVKKLIIEIEGENYGNKTEKTENKTAASKTRVSRKTARTSAS